MSKDDFESVGIAEMTSSKKSIRMVLKHCGFTFYVSIADLEKILAQKQQTATLWKPRSKNNGV
jgi:hypothetical protein